MIKIKKMDLYVDVDSTIYKSLERVVNILNARYGMNVNPDDIQDYGFKDKFSMLKSGEIKEIFDREDFYFNSWNMGALVVLSRIQKQFNINFVSMGTEVNLQNKRKALDSLKEFDIYYKDLYGSINHNNDKSFVDMSGGIMIDDNINCLRSCNAKVKILFRNNVDRPWNMIMPNDEVYVVNSWKEIYEILKFYIKIKEVV